jgi:polyisoprenyl-teichoic acid--peptidoglycan teichoic acid transferase
MPLFTHHFQARHKQQAALVVFAGILILAACIAPAPPEATPTIIEIPPSLSPSASATASATMEPTVTVSPTITLDPNIPWQSYPGPAIDPVIPIPPPAARLVVPDEVQVGILLGTDRPAPFVSRTDAMILMFYNPVLGRASLAAIPADLFVYIPGYTMQRLQVAYAVGGIEQVMSAVEYSFGVSPNHWALVHPAELSALVDEFRGIELDIPVEYPDACGGLKAERTLLKGPDVLCYVAFRQNMDELDRNQRQLQVVGEIFRRMVQGGNLVRLPGLVQTFEPNVESSYTLDDLVDFIPLALKLGDPRQLGFFRLQPAQLLLWDIPGQSGSQAFQPAAGALPQLVQAGLDFVLFAEPHGVIVRTLEYELTISPTPTITPTFTVTPSRTPIPTRTFRPTATRFTVTPSATRTATLTPTPSETIEPTPSETPTPVDTEEGSSE